MTAARDPQVDALVSEAQVAAHWRGEGVRRPPRRFIAQANAAGPGGPRPFVEVRFLTVSRSTPTCCPCRGMRTGTLDTSHPPFWTWFVGGG